MTKSARRSQNALFLFAVTVIGGLAVFFGSPPGSVGLAAGQMPLRLAYFPNITHAPAIVGEERGEFRRALGAHVAIVSTQFNAGPEEMEALLANAVDIGFVGPGPALNTYLKTGGHALKIISGACSGGAALVARDGANIRSIRDLDGKRVAVPLIGGTQDVSLRHFLKAEGLGPVEQGGSVRILPIKNPDILALFRRNQLDAAWVPEPWASRLVHEAHASLVVDERDLWPNGRFTTTVVVVRQAYLKEHPAEVRRFLRGLIRTINWLDAHGDEGRRIVNAQLKKLTGKELPEPVMSDAWSRVTFTTDPDSNSIDAFLRAEQEAGYLPQTQMRTADLLDLQPLEAERQAAGRLAYRR
jgi:NitT/TauT family transport system substrate-binding protein